jgi:FKBP-type peptidyl-prolyl cis-trans isomerase FkpA
MRALLLVLTVVLVGCSSSTSTGSGTPAGGAKAYLDKAAAQPGATRTDSGLVYRELRAGSGGSPKASDTVMVNYRGALVDGTEFDSSYKRNEPAQFPLNQVIPCWTEGVQKMKVGGKSELVCPASIAYGDQGSPPTIPGGATLVFEVELLRIGGA